MIVMVGTMMNLNAIILIMEIILKEMNLIRIIVKFATKIEGHIQYKQEVIEELKIELWIMKEKEEGMTNGILNFKKHKM
jgi:hypothetical protein